MKYLYLLVLEYGLLASCTTDRIEHTPIGLINDSIYIGQHVKIETSNEFYFDENCECYLSISDNIESAPLYVSYYKTDNNKRDGAVVSCRISITLPYDCDSTCLSLIRDEFNKLIHTSNITKEYYQTGVTANFYVFEWGLSDI